ncbi:unnamed protein product [Polarella glacialis]|uniref:Uncharacterized protein n=1 Tax=Polarella glacialis TaxID=89957 RepID=A0A813JY87_POLGL|nr:unnamed protein product [Polarella glacialis]
MAGMGKSASAGSLVNAGATMSHVPKRASQHGVHLPSWEVLPTSLKPGQASLESHVYAEEARPLTETYLQADMPIPSVYQKTISRLLGPEHYKDRTKPIRQGEPPESSAGHRGTSHWSSTYRQTYTEASVEGAQYHRQHGPSYQAANPPTCVGGGGVHSSYQQEFGLPGSDPRHKVDPNKARIPVLKSDLTFGTAKGTMHMPGYNGFLATNTRSPHVARVESGVNLRSTDKSNLTQQFQCAHLRRYATAPTVCKSSD